MRIEFTLISAVSLHGSQGSIEKLARPRVGKHGVYN